MGLKVTRRRNVAKQIFTKSFFRLSARDQAAVVNAEIRNLERETYLTPADQKSAEQQIDRITKKAERYGVYKPVQEQSGELKTATYTDPSGQVCQCRILRDYGNGWYDCMDEDGDVFGMPHYSLRMEAQHDHPKKSPARDGET